MRDWLRLVLFLFASASSAGGDASAAQSCFLLYDEQSGRTTREPSEV